MTHDHNHDHDHEFDEDTLVLIDEHGVEHEFVLLDQLEVDNKQYVVVMPTEGSDDAAFIFKVEVDEDGEEYLFDIEDDDEYERVAAAYYDFEVETD